MPTVLEKGHPICQVQICIQTKVQGYFDQRRECSLLQRQKQQPDWTGRVRAEAFNHQLLVSWRTEPGYSCPGGN